MTETIDRLATPDLLPAQAAGTPDTLAREPAHESARTSVTLAESLGNVSITATGAAASGDSETATPSTPTGEAVLSSWERQRYVHEAPSFSVVAADTSRTNSITSTTEAGYHVLRRQPYYKPENPYETTEHDGLVAVRTFLRESAQTLDNEEDRALATDMHENLTFIGEKEFNEATTAFSEAWKAYLDQSPSHKLGIDLGTLASDSAGLKSGAYILERVLANWTEDDWEKYGHRIERFTFYGGEFETDVPADITKMVILDDWVLTGNQAASSVRDLFASARFAGAEPAIEMQLITADSKQLEHGFQVTLDDGSEKTVPTVSYFRSHNASKTLDSSKGAVESYATGGISAGDYSFAEHIERMASKRQVPVPPLVEIVRVYKDLQQLPASSRLVSHMPNGL